jgi:TRIAD3 protein (E3 ubiquitin-protein ligase RNF216)
MTASLRSLNGLYAPTHLFLLEQHKTYEVAKRKKIKLPFRQIRLLSRSRSRLLHPSTPNKDISLERPQDEEFSRERAWLIQEVMDRAGSGIECGCCFATFRFVRIPPGDSLFHQEFVSNTAPPKQHEMVQCPEMHLFCITCMTSYASTLLGVHDPRIQCMDRSGCSALIPESEMRRFLSEKMVRLWERVNQRKEVLDAGLERLEECPFCDYGMVIENDEEKLFRCGNEQVCGVVSCRACKKPVGFFHP